MSITSAQKPMREWPLLVLTLGLVGAICIPLWQLIGTSESGSSIWTPQRWGQLLLGGPEQLLNYCCFFWAALILITRFWEVRRQRRAFGLDLLPIEEGARILQEDAWPLQRKVDQIAAAKGPFILTQMIRVALGKFALSRSAQDVGETVKAQAELDHSRLVSSMSTLNYLAWAIPAVGFLGTVRGLAGSMTMAGQGGEIVREATKHLTVAFDCTLVALALSLVVMFFLHMLQREEEALVIDCQQYCLEHLVGRIYLPEPLEEGRREESVRKNGQRPSTSLRTGTTFLPPSIASEGVAR